MRFLCGIRFFLLVVYYLYRSGVGSIRESLCIDRFCGLFAAGSFDNLFEKLGLDAGPVAITREIDFEGTPFAGSLLKNVLFFEAVLSLERFNMLEVAIELQI